MLVNTSAVGSEERIRLRRVMDPKTMPFDGRRMFWGGFRTIVEL
jgi:uncharacterized protein YbaA (DUF1428 family)